MSSIRRNVLHLGVFMMAVSSAGIPMSRAATMGSSSWLQVNLGWMPFSAYTSSPATSWLPGCPSSVSVRSCYQTILGQMKAQRVSGVRIIVPLCDSTSLAFNNCGQPYTSISWNPASNSYQQLWINNISTFFSDLVAAQIYNVTISIAAAQATISVPKSQTSSPSTPSGFSCASAPDTCSSDMVGISTVLFSPTQPFGLSSANNYPIGDYWNGAGNQGYNLAPVNPYFIGWNNEFNVIGAMLAAAQAQGVTVYELETDQELNLPAFTVLARYMYDNSSPQSASQAPGTIVNVVSALRSLMSSNGFDPGRVTWSSTGSDSSDATYNGCVNVYTDYGRNLGPDEVAEAINGSYIGINSDFTVTNALICAGIDVSSMFQTPIYSTQPDIVDVHIYPQAAYTTNTDAQIQDAAANDYGDLPHFLTLASLTSANIMIGETWDGTMYSPCWPGSPTGAPTDNVLGLNNESVSPPLTNYTFTARPWMTLSNSCFGYGGGPGTPTNYQSVNYNNAGPYTPTHY